MRRKIVMVLLGAGAVAGFGSGFARLAAHHHGWHGSEYGRHGRFKDRVAETCTDAALRVYKDQNRAGVTP
jgi:hypothetical protein